MSVVGIGFGLINFVLVLFGLAFSVLLFMLGIKALKALDIYIQKNQYGNRRDL